MTPTPSHHDYLEETNRAGLRYLGGMGKAINEDPDADEATSLGRLAALTTAESIILSRQRETVRAARSEGRSWSEIGAALQMSRQAAQQRYGGH